MKKGFIIFFAVMAVALTACGIYSMNSVDVLELQWQGVSYYDALRAEGEARTCGIYLIFFAIVCLSMCPIVNRHA